MISKLIAFVLTAGVCTALTAQESPNANNPVLGVWRVNLDESTYDPGPPPSEPAMRVYVDRGEEGIVATTHGMNAAGLPTFAISVSRYDGSEVGLFGIGQLADLLAAGEEDTPVKHVGRTIDRYTTEIRFVAEGETVTTETRTVSRDGRTMTAELVGTTPDGQSFHNVVVLDAVCGDTEIHQC